MTDPAGCCSPHQRLDLDRAVAAIQRHAFTALLANPGTIRIADIAETASREANDVAEALAWMEDHGRLERDGDQLVGAHGLTRLTTPPTAGRRAVGPSLRRRRGAGRWRRRPR